MHRIYNSVTMNNGVGSYDLEELAYHNQIRNEMDDMKKTSEKGYTFLIKISAREVIKSPRFYPYLN